MVLFRTHYLLCTFRQIEILYSLYWHLFDLALMVSPLHLQYKMPILCLAMMKKKMLLMQIYTTFLGLFQIGLVDFMVSLVEVSKCLQLQVLPVCNTFAI